MSNTVHNSGGIFHKTVGNGAVCRLCSGGCKVDCVRAGVSTDLTREFADDFQNSFSGFQDFTQYSTYDPIFDEYDD